MPYALKIAHHQALMRAYGLYTHLVQIGEPRLFVGNGSSLSLARTIAAHGVRNLLLVTDADLTRLGLYADVVAQLEELGVDVYVYDGIGPNPTEEEIDAGIAFARERGDIQAILAIGGGSPMDAAKIIAAGLTNDIPVSAMEGVLKIRRRPLPLYMVPTTAGTGAETTIAAVVRNTTQKRKYTVADHRMIPVAAALDPGLMTSLPQGVTAATGMDALTHAIEASISWRADDTIRKAGRTAVKLIFANLPSAYANGEDLAAREAMAVASYEAGTAICKVATGYVHAISHQVSGLYQTPHGLANAVLLPQVLWASLPDAAESLADLAVVAEVATQREPVRERASRFINAVEELSYDVGIPAGLKEIENGDVSTIAQRAEAETFQFNAVPRYLRQGELERIVRSVALN